MSLPTTIDRLQEANTAGACKLQLVRVEEVSAVPDEILGTIATAITLVGSAVWTTVYPTRFTQAFTEEYSNERGAQMSVARVGAVIPKSRVILQAGLYGLKPGRYLVLNHDLNGTVKLMGTLDEPAQVRVSELTHGADPQAGDRNQYLLEVVCTRNTPCPFYLADPPEPSTGTPGDCPTVGELLAAMTGAEIWAGLTVEQQDAILLEAGVVNVDGIDITGSPYDDVNIDIT